MLCLLLALACVTATEPAPAASPFAEEPAPSKLEAYRIGREIPADTPDPIPLTKAQAERAAKVLDAARTHLDKPWMWGGRDAEKHPGVDCLGLMFLADSAVSGRSWRAFEVNPSELVANEKLGNPVVGVAGVLRSELQIANLMPGDALYFLKANYQIEDEPLLVRGKTSYWPWHTGLYMGEQKVIHADPGGEVRIQPLEDLSFDALYATRMP